MQQLSKAGLVKSYTEAGGGYTLAQPPSEISFADVVRIFETEGQVLDCLEEARGCPGSSSWKFITLS